MALPKPYYGMYPADSIPVPASLNDQGENSPYWRQQSRDAGPYRDPQKVRQMMSDYYGLVTEVDDWIGKILNRLDELGLADNTLVIFTSDHGEMLGDHGVHSKMKFFEGAAHIPLLMRLPGVIRRARSSRRRRRRLICSRRSSTTSARAATSLKAGACAR